MSFLLVVNRLDALNNRLDTLINSIERLIAATTGVPIDEIPPIVIPPPELVISQAQLPNRYKIFRVDLSEAHDDEPLGVGPMLKDVGTLYASYMSIITVPDDFTFKLNSTDMDEIDAALGVEQKDFEITEMFVTNAVGVGIALINVEYRVD